MKEHSPSLLVAVLFVSFQPNLAEAVAPVWSSERTGRILTEVSPVDLAGRALNERPAELIINLKHNLLNEPGLNAVGSCMALQVVHYYPDKGGPIEPGSWAFGMGSNDCPFRWGDTTSNPYLEVETYLGSTSNGHLLPMDRPTWGNPTDSEGSWESGRLACSHGHNADQPFHCAVYFDLLRAETVPNESTRRGILGCGNMRTLEQRTTTTGLLAGRIDVAGWDGDGLVDIVSGYQRSGFMFYKDADFALNRRFGVSNTVNNRGGHPNSIGWYAAPKIVDFDGGGVDDVLTGGLRNRTALFKNTGTNVGRQLLYQGLVEVSSGQVLLLPTTPNPERPTITEDSDSLLDIIPSVYVTGRLYYYRNIGTNPDETPQLQLHAPLEATGAPIDTEWSAAPTFADSKSDRLKNIVTNTSALNTVVTSDKFLQNSKSAGTAFEQRPVSHLGDSSGRHPKTIDIFLYQYADTEPARTCLSSLSDRILWSSPEIDHSRN